MPSSNGRSVSSNVTSEICIRSFVHYICIHSCYDDYTLLSIIIYTVHCVNNSCGCISEW